MPRPPPWCARRRRASSPSRRGSRGRSGDVAQRGWLEGPGVLGPPRHGPAPRGRRSRRLPREAHADVEEGPLRHGDRAGELRRRVAGGADALAHEQAEPAPLGIGERAPVTAREAVVGRLRAAQGPHEGGERLRDRRRRRPDPREGGGEEPSILGQPAELARLGAEARLTHPHVRARPDLGRHLLERPRAAVPEQRRQVRHIPEDRGMRTDAHPVRPDGDGIVTAGAVLVLVAGVAGQLAVRAQARVEEEVGAERELRLALGVVRGDGDRTELVGHVARLG